MAKVMQPRLVTSPVNAPHPGLLAERPRGPGRAAQEYSFAVACLTCRHLPAYTAIMHVFTCLFGFEATTCQ
jgi:hypothetical protein